MDDDFKGNRLPPFPVDDATLDLLWAAMHPGPGHERTSVGDFLTLMDQLGGSDPTAVEWSDNDPVLPFNVMRDQSYHEHNVMSALVEEVRRLRAEVASSRSEGVAEGWRQAIAALRDEARYDRWWTAMHKSDPEYGYWQKGRVQLANYLASLAPTTEEDR